MSDVNGVKESGWRESAGIRADHETQQVSEEDADN
jgi:hypothetical protein